jgi:hypothetical protein
MRQIDLSPPPASFGCYKDVEFKAH